MTITAFIRRLTTHKPCTCAAYDYPHRLGSGYCRADRICQHDQDLDEGRCQICDSYDRADERHDGRADR